MLRQARSGMLVGTALSLVLAVPAHAQSGTAYGNGAEPWTGVYIGGGVSLDVLQGSLSGYGSDDYCAKFCDYGISLSDSKDFFDNAFNAEIEVGVDKQFSNGFVVGGVASFGWNFDKLAAMGHVSDTYTGKYNTVYPELDYFGEIQGTGSLLARVGHTVNTHSLIYALGGVTWAGYNVGGTYDVGNGPFSWSHKGITNGLTVGLGFETFVGAHTTLQLEYRYTDLNAVTVTWDDSPQFGQTMFDTNLHQVLAKFTYRFAGPPPPP